MSSTFSRAIDTAVVAAAAVLAVGCSDGQAPAAGPTDLTVRIDGQEFTLVDGVARNEAAPGSAAQNGLRVVGDPVPGDLTGDGRADDALLIVNDPGGSGTFYYAVVAVEDDGRYRATNVVPLGDRIVPQRIEFTDGRFVYEYLSRRPGEPLSVTPTVPTSTAVEYDRQSGGIRAEA